ncbi:MAG: NFACT family protein [Eubacteriales bacterium]
MAFDAGMLLAVTHEINAFCGAGGARVDKVFQPQKDEVVLVLHAEHRTRRLCLNAGAGSPRLGFTERSKDNPAAPPMFCMLLRKHLTGARLTALGQEGFERVARLCFSASDDMGFERTKYLIIEIMGKYSNLILLDHTDKILSPLYLVDFTTSRLRQVLPGMTYELPPPQDKHNPLSLTETVFRELYGQASPEQTAEKFLTATLQGVAPETARELVYRSAGDTRVPLLACPPARLWAVLAEWSSDLLAGRFSPTLLTDREGEPLAYAYMPLSHFEGYATARQYDSLGELFDAFFGARDRAAQQKLLLADLRHVLSRESARVERKVALQREEIAQAQEALAYRRQADLLTANLYRIKKGEASFVCIDEESPDRSPLTIPLDTRLTPAANAQKLYKVYHKAKSAVRILTEQIAAAEAELHYLATVSAFVERAETPEEQEDIRAELRQGGYLPAPKADTARRRKQSKPLELTTPGGYPLLCGKNNLQNDRITFEIATKGDLWFHVKGVPGSHVVLLCRGEEPSAEDYTFAATIAAFYSKAEGPVVPVDYTRVRHLKRPAGAKPGYVIYHTNHTAYVNPADYKALLGDDPSVST